ncbi:zinc finger protein 724-like [Daphnia pulicaria]|uniref:zinc finger protein 724-like n=1 Tax=Daphnia pulicaria TaxID=35523 RepID=UPI001EECAD9C|nr:zinc finger protein 724-like [Daphnia pulicaria]XP_046642909.1 zinc finger protein 724-like [Daphnia pulicaria]XP_046642910.1 zinc finger protein 724-like [Daphnia pulicaria]
MSDVIDNNDDGNQEASFVIFAEGPDGMTQIDQNDESQQLSIGDDGITIVVTPENEQQVSELLRALQASQGGEDVQIMTENGEEIHQFSKVKEEVSTDETEIIEPPKRKRGRPPKQQQAQATTSVVTAAETANKKAKLIELALQEADASVAEGVSNLKSSRLREKAAKQGGLKKLWLSKEDLEESGEPAAESFDRGELKSDGENEVYPCDECPELDFGSIEELKDHRKEIHPATFHCDICGIGFEDQIGFFEHLKTHYEKQTPKKGRGRPRKSVAAPLTPVASSSKAPEESVNVTCETCQKEFRNSKALDSHVRNAHPDAITKAYHCAQCNTSFRFKEAMETHMENVHGADRPEDGSAPEPGKSNEEKELDLAEFEAEEEGENVMGEIGMEEDEEDSEDGDENDPGGNDEVDELALQESGVAEYDPAIDGHCCQLCGAVFSAKKRLIQHLKEDHHIGFKRGRRPKYPPVETAEDGTFPCPVCNRTFTHKNSLAYHVRTHAGERPHQCEICGKSFFANGALKVHMRVHTGARPYKCDECGREFRQWGDLKYHFTSLHSGVRQYQCEFCGKSFARKYSLIVHRRVHTGERNYKCEFCGKGFRASSYLLNHRRIHTGEKPHPCPVCFKPFRMRSDMKRHMQMHARDGSDVSLLLACAEQGIDPLEAITADPDALAALREKTANSNEAKTTAPRGARGRKQLKSEEATAVATIQDDEENDEGSVMLTIVPNEDGEMVAVPIHVQDENDEDDDGNKMEVHMDGDENADNEEVQQLQLINEDELIQETDGLGAVTMRDPNTNTLYVWSVFPNSQTK